MQEIQEVLVNLTQYKAPNKQDWRQMSELWQNKLTEQIQLLQHMQTQLDWCIGCGCLSLAGCPLRNAEDHFAINTHRQQYWAEDYIEDEDLPERSD